jgi:hypothetical protein
MMPFVILHLHRARGGTFAKVGVDKSLEGSLVDLLVFRELEEYLSRGFSPIRNMTVLDPHHPRNRRKKDNLKR